MNLLQLRYFLKVATLENITKAANDCMIPQPAMSKMIAKLEKELGVKLFDRNKNALYLNEKGREFKAHVENILSELDYAVMSLQKEDDTLQGTIRILANENQRFIQGCVAEFSKANPEVNFHVSHDFRTQNIEDYDIGIISSAAVRYNSGVAVPLIREELALAVEENSQYATKNHVEISELKNEKFITTSVNSTLHSLVVECCKQAGFSPVIPFTFDDPYFVRKYVSESFGVAIAPTISWKGRFRTNTVIVPIIPKIYATSYIVWNDRKYAAPCVIAFRNFIIREAKKIDGNLAQGEQKGYGD